LRPGKAPPAAAAPPRGIEIETEEKEEEEEEEAGDGARPGI